MKLYRGKQTPEHKGDTSRELLDMWEESDYCEVVTGETNDVFLWANAPGDVLLYEYDRWDVYPNLPTTWCRGLFGGAQHGRGEPWIYWGRHPRKLEAKIAEGIKSYENRTIESLFLGKVENRVQQANRTQYDWSQSTEVFSMPMRLGDSFTWPFTQEEYLTKVSTSRFGLCLPGYGPKCNREIELLGLGVVPLLTEKVCVTYYDPLIEGQHYLRVANPGHMRDLIADCSSAQWKFLSYHGRQWYEKNCSRQGSFETTQRIVEGG